MRSALPHDDEAARLETPDTFWKAAVRYFASFVWLRSEAYRRKIRRYRPSLSPYAIRAYSDINLRYQRARQK